jgi:methylated-DNA-[protein]-cysteine S-methyltransferase
MIRYVVLDGPIGPVVIAGGGRGLTAVRLTPENGDPSIDPAWQHDPGAFPTAVRQLTAYFAGELRAFTLDLDPPGTPFQQAVWAALQAIPYGTTTTYGDLARRLGRPTAARAVGAANGQNPLAVVIPCHRLIGSDGSLTGYAGGLSRKRWLLDHELAHR